MTQVDVRVVGGSPLVMLTGPITERSGADLAGLIMRSINVETDDPDEYRHPLSNSAPRPHQ